VPTPVPADLVRGIGRWSFVALVMNSVLGVGLYGLPSTVAGMAGTASPAAVLAAGAGILLVVLCFAEVASRYDATGGPYRYVGDAFGAPAGFTVGWLLLWARWFSAAAVLNVLGAYVGRMVPPLAASGPRAAVMVGAVLLVTALNLAGVRATTRVTNAFTLAKLLPLAAVILIGAFAFDPAIAATQAVAAPRFSEALLVLVFGYTGFESSVVVAAEARDPARDAPFALLAGMLALVAIYALIQLAVIGTVPNVAGDPTPISSVLARVAGPAGATLGGVAVIVSVLGWLTSFSLTTSRLLFALADGRELPAPLARVDPATRAPRAAIVACSALALGLALTSSFAGAAALAALMRLITLAGTSAALPRLRRLGRAPFALPGGPVVPALALGFCGWLLWTRSHAELLALAGVLALGFALRFLSGRRPRPA
jgi:amino acid transporter